ncbi:MAG: hypothetical protein KIS92_00480 [Planctomycetota bacterium]|nr:hypothetical protein [Planctomycetota bacterium]
MIVCRECGYSCVCTQQEELLGCPHCDPSSWRIYTINTGNAYSTAISVAIRQSPFELNGRCFMTPKGLMIPLSQWRANKETNVWKKVHTNRIRRKLFEDEVPPRTIPPKEFGAEA